MGKSGRQTELPGPIVFAAVDVARPTAEHLSRSTPLNLRTNGRV
jgi:hypothetical protein